MIVYDYHPNAETLFSLHMKPKPPTFQSGRLQQSKDGSLLPEQTLWSYIIQLASAIQAVHDAGLAVRVVDSTKILVTSKNRYDSMTHCPSSRSLMLLLGSESAPVVWSTSLPTTHAKRKTSIFCSKKISLTLGNSSLNCAVGK